MSTVRNLLVEIAPEFSSEDTARLDVFIGLSASRLSARVFGRVYAQAVVYLAAHLLTLSERASSSGGSAAGPITSASTGGVSISYGQVNTAVSVSDATLSTTAYGLEFLALRNSRAGTKMKIVRA